MWKWLIGGVFCAALIFLGIEWVVRECMAGVP